MGYGHTVTAGVVSATDRTLELGNDVAFHGLIQTDASINPGNSGGPLLNALGELIGVNTAIRGDAQNIGFAIPVDQLREVLPRMLDIERRYRIVTGIQFDRSGTAAVERVTPRSPAAEAGIKPGERVAAVDGAAVGSDIDFDIALIGRRPGGKVRLGLVQADKSREVTLTLAERPRPDGAKLMARRLGLDVEPLTAKASAGLGVPGLRGLRVTAVETGGPSDALGLRAGDVVEQIGGRQMATLEDAGDLLETLEAGQQVPVSVLRLGGRYISRAQAVMKAR